MGYYPIVEFKTVLSSLITSLYVAPEFKKVKSSFELTHLLINGAGISREYISINF